MSNVYSILVLKKSLHPIGGGYQKMKCFSCPFKYLIWGDKGRGVWIKGLGNPRGTGGIRGGG